MHATSCFWINPESEQHMIRMKSVVQLNSTVWIMSCNTLYDLKLMIFMLRSLKKYNRKVQNFGNSIKWSKNVNLQFENVYALCPWICLDEQM